jgi:hypothetical protein
MTDISVTSPVERIARVLSAEGLSPNGGGREDETRAVSGMVDTLWRSEVACALAVLRTLREPTPEMVEAGRTVGSDPADIWNAMVRAALDQHADETV